MGLTDAPWAVLGPLIEQCRPHAKVPPRHPRRTISAIIRRHDNGARWRALPVELGPWRMAARTFIRWARPGVWECLLTPARARGVQLGMTVLDGSNVRAHPKAAGAVRKEALKRSGTGVRRLGARVAATAPRPA